MGNPENEPRFCVLYQWKLREGSESGFQKAWEDVTETIRRHNGGLGSRLHRMTDGWWAAYAQWPSRAQWEASQARGFDLPEAGRIMAEAIVERREAVLMEVVSDRLDCRR